MKKSAFTILFFMLVSFSPCFPQSPSAGKIEKMQQDLEMEKALRTELEKGKKVFIKKVILKGATLITEEQLKEIILPFKDRWLSGSGINLILDSITSAYKQKGYEGQPEKITFQVKDGNLEISIEEVKY